MSDLFCGVKGQKIFAETKQVESHQAHPKSRDSDVADLIVLDQKTMRVHIIIEGFIPSH